MKHVVSSWHHVRFDVPSLRSEFHKTLLLSLNDTSLWKTFRLKLNSLSDLKIFTRERFDLVFVCFGVFLRVLIVKFCLVTHFFLIFDFSVMK